MEGLRSGAGSGSFLAMLDPEDRAALLRLGHPRRYRRGATILLQGHRSETVFILLAGRVKVLLGTADGDEIVLAVLGAGELLGEFEAIEDHEDGRAASNVALEPVECRMLTAAEFLDFLDSHARATRLLLRVIIRRLRTADRRRVDSAALDTPHRLARYLVELSEAGTDRSAAEIDIDIPLTQEEVATLIATSRESVVRALASLRSRGLVTTARRRITIRDLNGLRQYAGW
jgi:CRP-like cAMP-binding protein